MASGKETPRQKMINLMYLIFIAMLALNMSKEVLQAFGSMYDRLTESNETATTRNNSFMESLAAKVDEQPKQYGPLKAKADQVKLLSDKFTSYIEQLKTDSTSKYERDENGDLPAEKMDKGDFFDEKFFIGDKLKEDGQEFLNQIKGFRDGVANILGDGYPELVAEVQKKFSTDDKKVGKLGKQAWIDAEFKGFPLIASITKMAQMQADAKAVESAVLSAMLAGEQAAQLSLSKYQAIVVPDKTAFFNGENFTGKIVLGKFDNSLNFDKITINGRDIKSTSNGQVDLKFPAGGVGSKDIIGELQFKEGDSIVKIPVKSEYAVINKPNSATISADKMNVVYRGVPNPMTISFAGVADSDVRATASGLRKVKGSQYIMDATAVSGREVKINVSAKLPADGGTVSDSKTFRVKDLPRPRGTVRGETTPNKIPRSSLAQSTIGAKFEDFDFNLPISVRGFSFKVAGQPTVKVRGNKLNAAAKTALKKAKRKATVTIRDIDAKAQGVNLRLKKIAPVSVELAD